MHSLIFETWEQFLGERYGEVVLDVYRDALQEAAMGIPMTTDAYENEVLLAGIAATSMMLKTDINVLLREYGRYFTDHATGTSMDLKETIWHMLPLDGKGLTLNDLRILLELHYGRSVRISRVAAIMVQLHRMGLVVLSNQQDGTFYEREYLRVAKVAPEMHCWLDAS